MPPSNDTVRSRDYSRVSEIPGIQVTREAVSMLLTRYAFAAELCKGKDVLELACGAGLGLRYLARHAQTLVGGDYTESMLSIAHQENSAHAHLVRLDAQRVPFKDGSFDVVLLFEAVYYLPSPPIVFQECRRVLRDTGTLLVCTANKEYPGFIPSALSCGYPSALELRRLLKDNGFEAEIYGGFPSAAKTGTEKVKEFIRKFAGRFDLVPSTMRRKQLLKRIFYGSLVELSTHIDENIGTYNPPTLIPRESRQVEKYKVIYAVARAVEAAKTGLVGLGNYCESSPLVNR